MTVPTGATDDLRLPLRARLAHNAITSALESTVELDAAARVAGELMSEAGLTYRAELLEEAVAVHASHRDVAADPYNVGRYLDGIPHGKIHVNAEAYLDDTAERYRGLLARMVGR